jgi:hypothetical protein
MAGLSSYCRNCGAPKDVTEYAENTCGKCETARSEAIQGAKAEKPELTESELLYVGRQALSQRAITSRQTWVNPRDFRRADMENK